MLRAAPQYMIASVSYWQGDSWVLEPGIETTRKAAETRLKDLREADFPINLRFSRKYRLLTMTQVKRQFGKSWHTHLRQ